MADADRDVIDHGLLLGWNWTVLGGAAGAELGLNVPRRPVIQRTLAEPAEGIGCDLGEAPADCGFVFESALLHDVPSLCAADLPGVILLQGVAPEDVPRIEAGIVDPQGRAVEHAGQ